MPLYDLAEDRRKNRMNEFLQAMQLGIQARQGAKKDSMQQLSELMLMEKLSAMQQQAAIRQQNLANAGIVPPGIATGNAVPPPVPTPSLAQLSSIQGAGSGGGLVPTGASLNTAGDITYTFGKNKAADKMAEDQYNQEKQLSGTGRFLQQFGRSWSELKSAYGDDVGKVGKNGWSTRLLANLNTKLDEHPETKAFLQELEPIANQMARDIEGGKITDKDRQIYAESFANTVKNPSSTNIRLASNALLKMRDRGGNIEQVLNELRNSDIDIMQSIALEVDKDELRRLKATIGRK